MIKYFNIDLISISMLICIHVCYIYLCYKSFSPKNFLLSYNYIFNFFNQLIYINLFYSLIFLLHKKHNLNHTKNICCYIHALFSHRTPHQLLCRLAKYVIFLFLQYFKVIVPFLLYFCNSMVIVRNKLCLCLCLCFLEKISANNFAL